MKINLLKMFFNTLIEIFCTLWIEMLSLSFSDSCDISKMEKLDTLSAKADLTYFIALALQKELSWNALAIVFEGFKEGLLTFCVENRRAHDSVQWLTQFT